jgi:hypothetical protein
MPIDADRLAQQVKLAYEFMEALHGQALALLKDLETQLAQTSEEFQFLRPGGYRYAVNAQSLSLERPQAALAEFYAVCFRRFEGRSKTTPLKGNVPLIGFIKIVLRERGLEHPEIRFGFLTDVEKPVERPQEWPRKVEDLVNHVTRRVLVGPAWYDQGTLERAHQDSYISLVIHGVAVRLADLPDSEAIAAEIIEPILEMYQELSD